MSNLLDIFKPLNPLPDWLEQYRQPMPSVSPLGRDRDSDDLIVAGPPDNSLLRRHYPVLKETGRIEIRQIRKVALGLDIMNGMATPRSAEIAPKVMIRDIRPFSRCSRTACYWEDAGWEKRASWLLGHYRAGRFTYPGSVKLSDSTYEPYTFFIYNPPEEILNGSHGTCFHRRGKPDLKKYWIHFSDQPPDIDSGIIQIEQDLRKALGVR